MSVGFNELTDLLDLQNVVQNSSIRICKDILIYSLKELFSKDSFYHYVHDSFGFPYTPNHTDLDIEAGLFDSGTTRVYIGEQFRGDVIYYPAILVKSGGFRSVPIGMNRNQHVVHYKTVIFVDEDDNERLVQQPDKFVLSGAWDQTINIEVLARSLRARDDLVEIISLLFTDWQWNELNRAGISIKPTVSVSGPSETDDRNDKLYRQTVTLEIRTEWRREIPITDVLDAINFCVSFGRFDEDDVFYPAPNLAISTRIELLDAFQPSS